MPITDNSVTAVTRDKMARRKDQVRKTRHRASVANADETDEEDARERWAAIIQRFMRALAVVIVPVAILTGVGLNTAGTEQIEVKTRPNPTPDGNSNSNSNLDIQAIDPAKFGSSWNLTMHFSKNYDAKVRKF